MVEGAAPQPHNSQSRVQCRSCSCARYAVAERAQELAASASSPVAIARGQLCGPATQAVGRQALVREGAEACQAAARREVRPESLRLRVSQGRAPSVPSRCFGATLPVSHKGRSFATTATVVVREAQRSEERRDTTAAPAKLLRAEARIVEAMEASAREPTLVALKAVLITRAFDKIC